MTGRPVVLASASPRRRELMRLAGVPQPIVLPADADETVAGNPTPAELVRVLARRKAEAVRPKAPAGALIVGSDTVVARERHILGKPADREDAARMLRLLRGATHEVFTGLCVLDGSRAVERLGHAFVTFRDFSDRALEAYLDTGEPMDKAGAYGIQGFGGAFVREIRGDYYSIVGLPVCALAEILQDIESRGEEGVL